MFEYFTKKKFFAGALLAWISFLNLGLPISAMAYQVVFDGSVSGGSYIKLDGTEYVVDGYVYNASGNPEFKVSPGQVVKNDLGAQVYTAPNITAGSQSTPPANDPMFDPAAMYGGNPTDISSIGSGSAQGALANDAGSGAAGGFGNIASNAIGTIGTCSIGAILGRLLSSLIGQMINFIFQGIAKQVVGVATDVVDCALHPFRLCGYDPTSANLLSSYTQKTTGYSNPSVTGMFTTAFTMPSLDSIMFCIVNEILTYITQATIKWINSGFNGNPVFVTNPGALLQQITNTEASNFIYSLSTGGRLPSPLNTQVSQGLINYYNGNLSGNPFASLPTPTLSSTQISSAQSGQVSLATLSQLYNPANGMYGGWAYTNMYAIPAMSSQISSAQQSQQLALNWSRGIQTPSACPPGYARPYDGTCNPLASQYTSSGFLVGQDLSNRNMMPYLRVAMAKDFDSIITALVNQLIKISVYKMFDGKVAAPQIAPGTFLNSASKQNSSNLGPKVFSNGSYNLNYAPSTSGSSQSSSGGKINLDNPPAGY